MPPGVSLNEPAYPDGADVLTVGDVDVEGMRWTEEQKAAEAWDRAHAVFGDAPEATPWADFLARVEAGEIDINAARDAYRAQPRCKAARAYDDKLEGDERWTHAIVGFSGHVEDYQIPRDEYIQNARDLAIVPYAYVMDSEWHGRGRMGWFGMGSDTKDSTQAFARQFNELFDSLPDDTVLTLVDCHI